MPIGSRCTNAAPKQETDMTRKQIILAIRRAELAAYRSGSK